MFVQEYSGKKSLGKAMIFILNSVISIAILIVVVLALVLVMKYIHINRTYPETIKNTDIPAGSVWEYEENGKKLIFKSYQIGYIVELETNTKTTYYEIGLLNDAGKYKYSMHIHKFLNNKQNTEYVGNCTVYFYKDNIKLEFDKEETNAFGLSDNKIVLKKILERGECVSDPNRKYVDRIYAKKVFLSQNSRFGMYHNSLSSSTTARNTLEGVFENFEGKEEHFFVFGLYSKGNTSTVVLRNINTFSYPLFTEEPLDENTYAICDFIDNSDSVTIKVKKSNNLSFKEGDEFIMNSISIKEEQYSGFTKAIENTEENGILGVLKDFSAQH